MGLYNRSERGICTKEGKSASVVKRRERRGMWVHWRTTEERVHQTLKLLQIALVFFIGKKDGKKHMVQNCRYLNE